MWWRCSGLFASRRKANEAAHERVSGPETWKQMFIKTRGILKELYSLPKSPGRSAERVDFVELQYLARIYKKPLTYFQTS
ncbi:MAG: hypothetical protein DMG32_16180 [Acidobacteria bacterium]|nr:MAG: hypothetical protein DMG32_16180 [Acidobacteriota bacterium]